MRLTTPVLSPMIAALALALAGCATAPTTTSGRQDLRAEATDALRELRAADPSLGGFLERSHGYVVFPRVGKGAWIVGGGYGRGVVYRQGAQVGWADITQASVGLQIGGQAYMEVLVFESAKDLERFQAGRFTLTANVSAVILKTGAAEQAKYTDGVAVFVKPIGGAMVEASVGGQQFSYLPE
jgi:lipid-binding SYLF domain-containing protein